MAGVLYGRSNPGSFIRRINTARHTIENAKSVPIEHISEIFSIGVKAAVREIIPPIKIVLL
jgi:hypothetical protein